jgi:hypothetical protein
MFEVRNRHFVEKEGHPFMQQTLASRPVVDRTTSLAEIPGSNEAHSSGVSWAAVIGGAFVAAALSLILISLGAGFGFSMVSPWANSGASASTVSSAAIFWLILTQILASALGGYLAGRLRTKWVQVHTDEVYFRDTAHGLLVWAVGLVITASLLATAATSLAGGAAQKTNAAPTSSSSDYFVDSLLRSNTTIASDAGQHTEVAGIFAHSLAQKGIAPADEAYLSQLVSSKTGLSKTDADKRVEEVFAEAQQAADQARKALAHLSLWIFVALLCGAFFASYAATIGGKQRDHLSA